jgi:hypothetical protein
MGMLGFVAALLFGTMMWFAGQAIEAAGHDPQLYRLCATTMCLTGAALAELLARAAG